MSTTKESILSRLRSLGEETKPMPIPKAAQPKSDEEWIVKNFDTSDERILFDRDEVLDAMRAVRQQILERAYAITNMGSSLHNPGDMINHLIKELEAGKTMRPQEDE